MMHKSIEYTFYGDLLGISEYYKIDSSLAYEKLNDFYNTTFYSLQENADSLKNTNVQMFSDSILIWGDDAREMLKKLHAVYVKLLKKGLMLRGAMVKGKIDFDPRLTTKYFKKKLPKNDTLARAVGLEKSYKGSRLLIEKGLARELLNECSDWLTVEGYIKKELEKIEHNSILRRICPTCDNNTYELLYFWVCDNVLNHSSTDYKAKIKELNEISKMLSDDVSIHYQETVRLLKKCRNRQRFTCDRME